MTTTSELHAIVEELGLIDMGDAASYLGEEALGTAEIPYEQVPLLLPPPYEDWEAMLLSA
jgi:hypothetical protein